MSLAERLKTSLARAGVDVGPGTGRIKIRVWEAEHDVPNGTLAKVLRGKRAPGDKVLARIAAPLGVSAAFLRYGAGAVADEASPAPSLRVLLAMLRAAKVPEPVLAALQAESHETDPGAAYWEGRAVEERKRFERLVLAGVVPSPAESKAPTTTRGPRR